VLIPSRYNPRAYVPGGSTPRVARAIQALGMRKRVPPRRPARPGVPGTPAVDPFLTRANTLTEQMFNPLFAKLGETRARAEQNLRSTYGRHATGLENALKGTAAPIAGAFDTGIAQAAKVNEAVANRLSGQGQTQGASLAAQLAQIGADQGAASKLASDYANVGNAQFARDAADLQHLIGRRGEALSYTGKLPGIGRLTAAQDLSKALSESGAEFAEQESSLKNAALDRSFDLYGTLRGEAQQDRQLQAQARQNELDRRADERQALMALKAAALDKRESRMYEAMLKSQERQWELEDQQWEAQQDAIEREQGGSGYNLQGTGSESQFLIDPRTGQVIGKNPNYRPPGAGSSKDNWTTPGSAKRDRVVSGAIEAVVDPDNITALRGVYKEGNIYPTLMNKINHAMVLAGVPRDKIWGKEATALRRSLFQMLVGKTLALDDGGSWTITQEEVNSFTKPKAKKKNKRRDAP
jgi:hypothetical protein